METNLKIHIGPQKTSVDKIILNKKNKAGGITIYSFKIQCKDVVMRTALYLHKNIHIAQCNMLDSPSKPAH